MRWKPHVTVATIVHRDDQFLMVEEQCDGLIVYNQPAGHLEDGRIGQMQRGQQCRFVAFQFGFNSAGPQSRLPVSERW